MSVAFGDEKIDEGLADAGNGGEIHDVFLWGDGGPWININFTLGKRRLIPSRVVHLCFWRPAAL